MIRTTVWLAMQAVQPFVIRSKTMGVVMTACEWLLQNKEVLDNVHIQH